MKNRVEIEFFPVSRSTVQRTHANIKIAFKRYNRGKGIYWIVKIDRTWTHDGAPGCVGCNSTRIWGRSHSLPENLGQSSHGHWIHRLVRQGEALADHLNSISKNPITIHWRQGLTFTSYQTPWNTLTLSPYMSLLLQSLFPKDLHYAKEEIIHSHIQFRFLGTP